MLDSSIEREWPDIKTPSEGTCMSFYCAILESSYVKIKDKNLIELAWSPIFRGIMSPITMSNIETLTLLPSLITCI